MKSTRLFVVFTVFDTAMALLTLLMSFGQLRAASTLNRANQLNPEHEAYWKSRTYVPKDYDFMHDFKLVQGQHIKKNFNEHVSCIAVGGICTILLYDDGDFACTSGLPDSLYKKLMGRMRFRGLSPPVYAALGSDDRYYVRFADGSAQWVGCDAMTKGLRRRGRPKPASVAFGKSWDSYFVVFEDGGWNCNNVPEGLSNLMQDRQHRGDLNQVSLGPNGEWFVEARDGRAWWDCINDSMAEALEPVCGLITFMDFGEHNTFYFEYDESS